MRLARFLCAAIFVVSASLLVRADDSAAAPQPPAFETAPAKSDELPPGVRIVEGLKCASRAAGEFWIDPGFAGSLDCPPQRKSFQSFQRDGGAAGSVLLFEYAGAVPSFMQRVLARSLWGEGSRSPVRPDEIVVHGRLLWIVSFPYGDPTAEWVKDRLRKRFRVPARRTRPSLVAAERKLWDLVRRGDVKAGTAALDAADAEAADWSIGAYLRAEFATVSKDWAAAETSYRRAVELHETLTDPLPDNLAWAATDGIGVALLYRAKYEDAAKVLARSKAEGRALRLANDETPHTAFALACALARLGTWGDALRELTDAVDGDRRWFELALTDDALAAARLRPEFRVLLELDPPRPAPLPPKPAGPAKPAEAVTFDAVLVKQAELPAGWTLVEGSQCVSTTAHKFFVTPDSDTIASRGPGGIAATGLPPLARPVRKSCQSIVRPDGSAGSVLTFEYPADVDPGIVAFLSGYCWGTDAGPSNRNPEEIVTQGRFLWILSFPRGDAAGEWVKDRLRRRFRVPALRTRPELAAAMKRVFAANKARDVAAGLRLLDARASLLADCAFAWYLRGEFCIANDDPRRAEVAYRRAVELHDTLVDPLPDSAAWASLDGLGGALLRLRKLDEARTILGRAKAYATLHRIEDASVSSYNLACTLALMKRWGDALAELKAVIAAKASWKDTARDDADFAEARERPDFQALLAK